MRTLAISYLVCPPPFVLLGFLFLEPTHTAPGEDSRHVKGSLMEKLSLLTWRRRETKFPDTEAQRRARAREQRSIDESIFLDVDELNALESLVSPPCHNGDEEEFPGTGVLAQLFTEKTMQARPPHTRSAPTVDQLTMSLTAEQSRALLALPSFPQHLENESPRHLFQLEKIEDAQGVKLSFSLYSQQIPEMISLKELCAQLKVGRRTVMRLIHQHGLRCYRIAHRYRFAVKDVQDYLACNANLPSI
jgi:excisionase family DNA binding protein